MKRITLCLVLISLFTAGSLAQTSRKKSAVVTYISSMSGNSGGEVQLKLIGKIVTFVWDRDGGTTKLPIFQSNVKGFQKGAEWNIVYLEPPSEFGGNTPFLLSAIYTGRNLSEITAMRDSTTGQVQSIRRIGGPQRQNMRSCESLLRNGSFGNGFSGWKVTNFTSGATTELITEHGNSFVRMSHIGEGDWCSIGQEIRSKLKIGKTYVVSIKYKVESNLNVGIRFGDPSTIMHSSAINQNYGWNHLLTGTRDWREDTFEFTAMETLPKSEEPMFVIYFDYYNKGEIFVDDILVAEKNRSCPSYDDQDSIEFLARRPRTIAISGYIDVVELSGSSCQIRIIAGENLYLGVITFSRLSALTNLRIRSYGDAVAVFDGKETAVTLTGLESPGDGAWHSNFSGISHMTILFGKNPNQTKQRWSERTTDTETIIDLSTDILFEFNKSTINPNAIPSLITLARLLRQSKSNTVQLNGFTDSIGSDEYNIGLSQRRAAAVKQWLVRKGGVDAGRLVTNGYGKGQPVAPNTNQDGSDNPIGRQKNRRVEIRIPRG